MGRLLFNAFVAFVNLLPRPAALRFGSAFGSLLYSLVELTRFKGAVRRNIRTAFGDCFSDQEVARMARQHGRDLITSYIEAMRMRELPELYKKGLIQVEGLDNLAKVKEQGKGAILLSAHMGNFELFLSIMGFLGYPVHDVAVKQSSDWFNDFIVRERQRFGSKVVYLKEVNSERVQQIFDSNGILLLFADQHNYGGKARNIVDFFGKPVSVAGGPIAYSTKFGVPIIPGYIIREPGGHHRIIIEPPLELIDTGNPTADFQANCELYYQVYERWIRTHPGEWMWSHERWEWLDENLQPKFG